MWGDLGAVLISGLVDRPTPDADLSLSRTGPFLPPISFPWLGTEGKRIVVSDSFRHALEQALIPDLHFRTVKKERIVRLPWHDWDLTAVCPAVYPSEEPEGYITDSSHDPQAAADMPPAWELVLPFLPVRLLQAKSPQGEYLDWYFAEAASVPAQTPSLFVNRERFGHLIATDEAREWLEKHVGEWVRLCPVRTVDELPTS